jgi:transcriptional regulator with XRE-family HTH domain
MRIRRAALDLTQFKAARLAGVHPLKFHRIENGIADPTPDERKAIAKALKAKADDLFPDTVSA